MDKLIKKILFLTLVMLLFSCEDSSTGSDNNNQNITKLSEETVEIDENTLELITSISDNGAIVFSGSSETLESIQKGSVLASGIKEGISDYGFLRKVVSIDNTKDDEIVVQTEQATLKDAFKSFNFGFESDTLEAAGIKKVWLKKGVTFKGKNNRLLGFDLDFQERIEESDSNYIDIKGDAFFSLDFKFVLDYELDLDEIVVVNKFESSVAVNQSANLNFKAEGNVDKKKKIKIATITFNPWMFSIGGIPVVFVPKATLYVGMDGKISAKASGFVSESYFGKLGIQYKSGIVPIAESDFDFDMGIPECYVDADAKIYAGPEAKLLLYGVAGCSLDLFAYGKFDFTAGKKVENTFKLGVESNYGVSIEVFGLELLGDTGSLFNKTLKTYTFTGDVEESIVITSPADGAAYLIGEEVAIQTHYTGEIPEQVLLYIDSEEVMNTNTEPFSFKLNTSDLDAGAHKLKVIAEYSDSNKIESKEITITIGTPTWERIDLSNVLAPMDQILGIHFITENTGFFCGGYITDNKQFIYKTTDGGLTWKKKYESDEYLNDGALTHIFFTSNDCGFAGGGSKILYTADGGETWTESLSYPGGELFTSVTTNGNGSTIASGASAAYILSEGQWLQYDFPTLYGGFSLGHTSMDFGGSNGALVGYNTYIERPLIIRTSNNGYDWELYDPELQSEEYMYDVTFADNETGYICGENQDSYEGFLLKTIDSGQTWQKIENPDEYVPPLYNIHFLDKFTGFTAGDGSIFYTSDGGTSWNRYDTNNYTDIIYSLYFLDKNRGWAAGDGRFIMKYSNK